MNVRKVNLSLWSATAVLAAAAVGALAWGVLSPVEVASDAVRVTRPPATSQASPDTQLSLEAFEPIWAMSLRRSAADPAPATNAANTQTGDQNPTAPSANGPFVLVGTIGTSLAMIRTNTGIVEVKGVGESASGAKILAIRPMQVDLEMNGVRTTLTKPREANGG